MKRTIFLVASVFLSLFSIASVNDSLIHKNYSWSFAELKKECTLDIPGRLLDYYRNDREHLTYRYSGFEGNHTSDYDYFGFMFSEYDREVIRQLMSQLVDSTMSDYEMTQVALTFVQSLPYVLDEKSKNQREYVRYPIETLVDGEGDCEDKVILLGAMMQEIGMDFVLLLLPDHMALGVCCKVPEGGGCLKVGDKQYFYMETTASHWGIGQIPEEYRHTAMELLFPSMTPVLVVKSVRFQSEPAMVFEKTQCFLQIELFNAGPGRITNLRLHLQLVDNARKGRMFAEEQFILEDMLEGEQRSQILEFRSLMKRDVSLVVSIVGEQIPNKQFEISVR